MKRLLIFTVTCIALLGCSSITSDHEITLIGKCTVCHNLPPVGKVHDVHSGKLGYDCSICHPGYRRGVAETDSQLHNNGTMDVVFSPEIDSLGTGTFDAVSKSCNATYCHGYFPQGDSAIVSESDSIGMRCSACHNLALMKREGHKGHTTVLTINNVLFSNDNCGFCHAGYNVNAGRINDSTHCDGKVQTFNCTKCPHR